jgi:archaellum component FlaC
LATPSISTKLPRRQLKGNDVADDLGSSSGSADNQADSSDAMQALRERAEQLNATAEELEAALEQLALHAEVVLRRLRGEAMH